MQTTRTLLVVEICRVVVQDEAVALLPIEELGATGSCRRGRIRGTSSVVRAAARWILQTVSSTYALGREVLQSRRRTRSGATSVDVSSRGGGGAALSRAGVDGSGGKETVKGEGEASPLNECRRRRPRAEKSSTGASLGGSAGIGSSWAARGGVPTRSSRGGGGGDSAGIGASMAVRVPERRERTDSVEDKQLSNVEANLDQRTERALGRSFLLSSAIHCARNARCHVAQTRHGVRRAHSLNAHRRCCARDLERRQKLLPRRFPSSTPCETRSEIALAASAPLPFREGLTKKQSPAPVESTACALGAGYDEMSSSMQSV